jgi:ElaB/YqjD/DUF883 family membrane-anchored ribosome-binding protein
MILEFKSDGGSGISGQIKGGRLRMEPNKNISQEQHRVASEPASGSRIEGSTTGTVTQRAREMRQEATNAAQQGYEQARQAVTDAYEKTAETLNQTYDQAMEYGRANPGKLTLIAFGAGIGIGVLLTAAMTTRPTRSSRIIQPVVGALSEIAYQMFR